MTTPIDLPGGYYTLPPGRLANAVTWLAMRSRPSAPLAKPLRLVAGDAAFDAALAAVGAPWLWSPDAASRGDAQTRLVARDDGGRPIGVVALCDRAGDVEIVYFGLLPEALGQRLGRRMMAAVLDRVWPAATRLWLHTCSFDHPGALGFYRACGFVPYATGFEVMDDPRLSGRLPREVAAHVPLIEPRGYAGTGVGAAPRSTR